MLVIVLILSTILAISSSSWTIVWIFIEVNTISICIIIENHKNISIENNQTTVNYYIVQCVASIILLSIMITTQVSQETNITLGVIILLINIGVWPFHIWYINVLSELNISEKPFLIIVTWQKIIPVIVIISLINVNNYEIIAVLVVNIITIVTILKNNTSVNSIIVLSSGFNNSLIICSAISVYLITMFISIYSISVIIVLNIIENNSNNE